MKKVFVTGGSGFVGQNLIPMLIERGYTVKALTRSKSAAEKVQNLGATAVLGDLLNEKALADGAKDCESVFHLAASVDFFASEKALYDLHVTATQLLLHTAQKAGVQNFVYLGAASVIMNGKPIRDANEDFKSDFVMDGYSRTKLRAEQLVLAANQPGFKTISLRPPLIWGKGDPNVLPAIIEAVKKGQMQFIGGGQHQFVTCHVKNVCEALILGEKPNQGGRAYFITDGEYLVFKDFIKKYVATQGVTVPDKSVSLSTAKFIANIMEFVWKTFRLNGHPPLYKAMVNTLGLEFMIDDNRARRELNYQTFVTVNQGLAEMES